MQYKYDNKYVNFKGNIQILSRYDSSQLVISISSWSSGFLNCIITKSVISNYISLVRWNYLKQSHWSDDIILSNLIGHILSEAILLVSDIIWSNLIGQMMFSEAILTQSDGTSRCGTQIISSHSRKIFIIVQDNRNSIANALELLQYCTKPLTCWSSRKQKDKTMSCSCSAVDVTWPFDGVSFHQAQQCLHLPADMKAWDMQGMQKTNAMCIHSQ